MCSSLKASPARLDKNFKQSRAEKLGRMAELREAVLVDDDAHIDYRAEPE